MTHDTRAIPIHIRRMRLEDVDAVHAIDMLAFPTPWPRRAYLHELTDNPSGHLWVAVVPGVNGREQVIGMIGLWLIADEVHISTLATHPEFRRQGVARRLLSSALAYAIQSGARIATLEVRQSNAAAQDLYRSCGFQIVGRRRAYYKDNREDALLMTAEDLSDLDLAAPQEAPSNLSEPPFSEGNTHPGGEM